MTSREQAPQRNPSKLRREIYPESEDDEDASSYGTIQEPDSQLVGPATQDDKAPLTPRSRATFDAYFVRKRTSDESDIPKVTLLTKPDIFHQSSSQNMTFTFDTVRIKGQNKGKLDTVVSSNSAHAAHKVVQKDESAADQTSNGPDISGTTSKGIEKGMLVAEDILVAGLLENEVKDSQLSSVVPESQYGDDTQTRTPKEVPSVQTLACVSAQPEDWSKKQKKRATKRYRGAAWPPRSTPSTLNAVSVSAPVTPTTFPGSGLLKASPTPMEEVTQVRLVPQNMAVVKYQRPNEEGISEYDTPLYHQKMLIDGSKGDSSKLPMDRVHLAGQKDNGSAFTKTYVKPQRSSRRVSSLKQDQISCEGPMQHTSILEGDEIATEVQAADVQTIHNEPRLPIKSITIDNSSTAFPFREGGRVAAINVDNARNKTHSRQHEVLREISEREVSPRIAKTQGNLPRGHFLNHRTVSTTSQKEILQPLSSFRKAIEAVDTAYSEERLASNREHLMEVKHFHEIKCTLESQIQLQTDSLTEWKEKYNVLQKSVLDLREKAKTNQKYVAGLQADYEKLQKSTVNHQAECKRELQANIAQIYSERESLRSDFERTVDVMAKSQKHLKDFADEMAFKLMESELKRGHLTRKLSDQLTAYLEQKEKCEGLEKTLETSIETTVGYFAERAQPLMDKLDLVVHNLQTARIGKTEMVEIINTLRNMQQPRMLTMTDVEKAENMLQAMNKNVEVKLDLLYGSVKKNHSSMEDAKNSFSRQLIKLTKRLDGLKDSITVSTPSRDASDYLQNQPKLSQQCLKELEKKVENLQDAIQHLTTQSSQHETARLQCQSQRNDREVQEVQEDARKVRLELETVSKEKMEIEGKLRASQCTLQELNAEATELNRRFQTQDNALKSKDTQVMDMKQGIMLLETQIAEIQSSMEKTKSQHSLELSQKEALLHNDKTKWLQECEKNDSRMREMQKQLEASEKRNGDLLMTLEQNAVEKHELSEAHVLLRTERDDFQVQLAKMLTEKNVLKERLQKVAAERIQTFQNSNQEVDDLRRELSQSMAALSEAEVKNRLQEAEHKKKLDIDRRVFSELAAASQSAENESIAKATVFIPETLRTLQQTTTLSQDLCIQHNRKKVNRENKSALKICPGIVLGEEGSKTPDANVQNAKGTEEELSGSQTLFEETFIDDFDDSILDPAPIAVQQTQEQDILPVACDYSEDDVAGNPIADTKSRAESTGGHLKALTNPETVDIEHHTAISEATSTLAGRRQNDGCQRISMEWLAEALPRSDDPLSDSIPSSRPRSQANTASRMTQPKVTQENVEGCVVSHRQVQSKKTKDSVKPSTPDYLHEPSSASKHIYGKPDNGSNTLKEQEENVPCTPQRSIDHKRKFVLGEEGLASKKTRISEAADLTGYPRSSASYSDHEKARARECSPSLPKSPLSRPGLSTSSAVQTTCPNSPQNSRPRRGRPAGAKASGKPRQPMYTARKTRSKTAQEDRFYQELLQHK